MRRNIAFTADIKAMFFRIFVDPHGWDSLRLLWRSKDDFSWPPENSSPACANYAFKKIVEDNRDNASSETLSTVTSCFYVDSLICEQRKIR